MTISIEINKKENNSSIMRRLNEPFINEEGSIPIKYDPNLAIFYESL